jgi:hypothetical protein
MDVIFASAFIFGFGTYMMMRSFRQHSKEVDPMEPLQLPSPIFKGVSGPEVDEPLFMEDQEPSLKDEQVIADAHAGAIAEAEAPVANSTPLRYSNPRDAEIFIYSRPLMRTTDIPLFESEIVRGLRKHADTPRVIRTVLEAHGYSPITLEHLIDAIISSDVLRPAVPLRKAQKAEGIKGLRHELIWHLQRLSRLRAVSMDGL